MFKQINIIFFTREVNTEEIENRSISMAKFKTDKFSQRSNQLSSENIKISSKEISNDELDDNFGIYSRIQTLKNRKQISFGNGKRHMNFYQDDEDGNELSRKKRSKKSNTLVLGSMKGNMMDMTSKNQIMNDIQEEEERSSLEFSKETILV